MSSDKTCGSGHAYGSTESLLTLPMPRSHISTQTPLASCEEQGWCSLLGHDHCKSFDAELGALEMPEMHFVLHEFNGVKMLNCQDFRYQLSYQSQIR